METKEKLKHTYDAMQRHLYKREYLDDITNAHIRIAQLGMLDCLKVWFEEELDEMGLDSKREYGTEKPELI